MDDIPLSHLAGLGAQLLQCGQPTAFFDTLAVDSCSDIPSPNVAAGHGFYDNALDHAKAYRLSVHLGNSSYSSRPVNQPQAAGACRGARSGFGGSNSAAAWRRGSGHLPVSLGMMLTRRYRHEYCHGVRAVEPERRCRSGLNSDAWAPPARAAAACAGSATAHLVPRPAGPGAWHSG